MKAYRTLKEPCEIELVIKKSRFFGRLYPVESFEQAQEILEQVKRKYWDASHNCSAMVIGEAGEYTRCSDDGEPQGTAGVPMLEALKLGGLTNVLAVVTRYFGGVLLGAGGLVRAYTASVAQAVHSAKKVLRTPCRVFSLSVPFSLWGKAQSQLLSAGFQIGKVEYLDEVCIGVYVPGGQEQSFYQLISELSSGRISPIELGEQYLETQIID